MKKKLPVTSFTLKKKTKGPFIYIDEKLWSWVEWVDLILAPLLWSFLSSSHLSQTWVSSVIAVLINFFMFISGLILDCKKLPEQIPSLKINHCFHEANQSADTLLRKGSLKQKDFVVFNNPPLDRHDDRNYHSFLTRWFWCLPYS